MTQGLSLSLSLSRRFPLNGFSPILPSYYFKRFHLKRLVYWIKYFTIIYFIVIFRYVWIFYTSFRIRFHNRQSDIIKINTRFPVFMINYISIQIFSNQIFNFFAMYFIIIFIYITYILSNIFKPDPDPPATTVSHDL